MCDITSDFSLLDNRIVKFRDCQNRSPDGGWDYILKMKLINYKNIDLLELKDYYACL